MSIEKCPRLFFRVLGRRLVVFDRVAKSAAAGLQNRNIEGMAGARVDVQRNRRAIGPRMSNHLAAAFHGVQSSRSPARIKVGAVNVTNGRRQAG